MCPLARSPAVIQDINAPATPGAGADAQATPELSKAQRLAVLVGGMLTPFVLAMVVHGD